MRLFVAIEAPEAWRDAARAVQSALRTALPPEVARALRMVPPSLMHVTLRFVGETDEAMAPALRKALDAAITPFAIELTLGHATTFGPDARASVVVLGIEGQREALGALAARVDGAVVSALGVMPETREFNPHLTLARVDQRLDAAGRRVVASTVRSLDPPPMLTFTARQCLLVRSHLEAGGARYETLSHHRG